MINTKQTREKKVAVVKRVNVPATLRKIPHGTTVRFSRREMGPESTVRSAISRENAKHVDAEFTLLLVNDGLYYDITRR